MIFDDAYKFVEKEEGGYVNDPSDSGGATNFGVTQKTYDLYRTSKSLELRAVRYITRKERSDIFEGIWRDCKASLLPPGLNLMHFDYAVNAGNHRAATALQDILDVRVDGIIGPNTLAKVKDSDVEILITDYARERERFYKSLAERRPKDKKFLKGWLLRVRRCEKSAFLAHRRASGNK